MRFLRDIHPMIVLKSFFADFFQLFSTLFVFTPNSGVSQVSFLATFPGYRQIVLETYPSVLT